MKQGKYILASGVIVVLIASTLMFLAAMPLDVEKLSRQGVFLTRSGRSGGTSFVVKAGDKNVLLTNQHICRHSTDGTLALEQVRPEGEPLTAVVNIQEMSIEYDLCVATAPPNVNPLTLDNYTVTYPLRGVVWGHPKLGPLTRSEGVIVGEEVIQMMTGFGASEAECAGDLFDPGFPPFFPGVCYRRHLSAESTIKIQPGNSGSPVFNDRGYVVGVVFAGQTATGNASIIPLKSIKTFLGVE